MKAKKNMTKRLLKIVAVFLLFICNSTIGYGQEEDEKQDAVVTLSFSEEDSRNTITATATDKEGLPIEELDIYFYIKRTFSLLSIGDAFNTTNENGEVVVQFPKDMPADTEGNVAIVVKIIESDLYNDLEIETIKKWGIPIEKTDYSIEKRSLWAAAANAPITLVLTVSGMILVIWFIICYIIFILIKISKVKPI